MLDGAPVLGDGQFFAGIDLDFDLPLAQHVHHAVAHGQSIIERIGIPDGKNHIGSGVLAAVYRYHRTGAADLAGSEKAFSVERDGLCPGGAKLVDHSEEVGVVDEVISLVPRGIYRRGVG